jgi:hypothetical protein
MNLEGLYAVVLLALMVAALSVTITKAKIFERQRDWIYDKNGWLGKLVQCPYCSSHWLSLGVVLVYQPTPGVTSVFVLDLIASVFIIVALAAPASSLIMLCMGMSNKEGSEGYSSKKVA